MTVIMDGKKLAQEVKAELKQRVEELWTSKQIVPRLAVILVGEDPARFTSEISAGLQKKSELKRLIISYRQQLVKPIC